MSDLQCPVTLVVVRHAEAAFLMARFSDEGGSLTPGGRAQARELAETLTGGRVAAAYCSDLSPAVQTAEIVAARLGVAVTARKALREVDVGDPTGRPNAVAERWYDGSLDARFEGGESGTDVVARHRALLEEVADLHRGETVLVVGHPTALGIVVPTLAANLTPRWARQHELANTEAAELQCDADGWVVRRWGSRNLAGA